MANEIEKKFLVQNDLLSLQDIKGTPIVQGFLSLDPERVVRLRLKGDKGVMTVKGKSYITESGARKCPEFEYNVPAEDCRAILETMAAGFIIEKTRYEITYEGHLWEIDVFHGENEGLVLAEVELPDEETVPALPAWVGQEVSADNHFTNVWLAASPYSTWGQ